MGTTLTGTTPQDTYDSLIKVTDNGPLSGSLKKLTDGLGNDSALSLSTGAASVTGTLAVSSGITSTGANTMLSASSSTEGLVVRGGSSIGTASTASGQILIGQTGTYRGSIAYDDNAGYLYIDNLYNNNAGNIYFRTKTQATAVEALTILGSGNVGIGTSSPNIGGYVAGNTVLTMAPSGADKFSVLQLSGNRGFGGNQNGNIDFINSEGTATITSRISGINGANALDGQIAFETRTSAGSLTERLRITSTGVVELAQGQIKFPATQVASADPNTLDDYEEGTFTATLKGSTTDPTTAVTTTGYYTKIGRQVSVSGYFSGINNTGASGAVSVSGVPFAAAAASSLASGSSIANLFDFQGRTSLQCYISSSSTIVDFLVSADDVAFANLAHTAGTGRSLSFALTYFV